MPSNSTALHSKENCYPDFAVPRAKAVRRSGLVEQAPRFKLNVLQALLIPAVGSIVMVALSEERMGLEGISWILLTLAAVAALPLLGRIGRRGGVAAFGVFSMLVLAHSEVFGWPLDLREAQLVVALLGFALMFYLTGSEMAIGVVLSVVFFGSSVLSRGIDFSVEALSMPLVLTGVLAATAAAIG